MSPLKLGKDDHYDVVSGKSAQKMETLFTAASTTFDRNPILLFYPSTIDHFRDRTDS